jgi:hypothetical protein
MPYMVAAAHARALRQGIRVCADATCASAALDCGPRCIASHSNSTTTSSPRTQLCDGKRFGVISCKQQPAPLFNLISNMKENLLGRPEDHKSGDRSPCAQEPSLHGQ